MNPTETADERALVQRALAGDEDAYRCLFDLHRPAVVAIVRRRVPDSDVVEDLTQQTFISAFGALDRFRGEAIFGTWIIRIAINVCLSYRRSEKTHRTWITLLEDVEYAKAADSEASRTRDPITDVLANESRELVLEGIKRLPERYRKAVWLRYVKDLSYEEIMHALQVPMGTVKTWLNRARAQLAKEFRRLGLQPV